MHFAHSLYVDPCCRLRSFEGAARREVSCRERTFGQHLMCHGFVKLVVLARFQTAPLRSHALRGRHRDIQREACRRLYEKPLCPGHLRAPKQAGLLGCTYPSSVAAFDRLLIISFVFLFVSLFSCQVSVCLFVCLCPGLVSISLCV